MDGSTFRLMAIWPFVDDQVASICTVHSVLRSVMPKLVPQAALVAPQATIPLQPSWLQLEEELGQLARSTDQVVEVIPFSIMDGEDSPWRVLCPWRVHPPASTFPAVARAMAGRFVRCEWLVGRGVCVPRGSAGSFCVRCSPHG